MAKIIKFSAIVALLNVCINTAGASYPNKGSPINTKNTKVDCDGRKYGPSDYEAAEIGFKLLNGKEKRATDIPNNHYTSRSKKERYYYYPIGNGPSMDFAVITSSYMDVVDVVMKQRKGAVRACLRSQIAEPEPKPAPEGSKSSGPSQPSNSGGGLDYEYSPYSQFHSGSFNPGAGYPSQPYGGCPPQGCPRPQPYGDFPSQPYGGCPPQGCPRPQPYGDSYGYGGQPQQNPYAYGYGEPQQFHNPYGDGAYDMIQDCHESQVGCTVM